MFSFPKIYNISFVISVSNYRKCLSHQWMKFDRHDLARFPIRVNKITSENELLYSLQLSAYMIYNSSDRQQPCGDPVLIVMTITD